MVKIAFIQAPPYPLLSVEYLAAVAIKQGYELEVFVASLESDITKKVCDYNPDITAFCCSTNEYPSFLVLAKKIKNEINTVITFGGPHPTFCPEIINEDCIDIVCRGEGEAVFSDILKAVDSKKSLTKIKNVWVKKRRKVFKNNMRPLISNLDCLPFPDNRIYHKYPMLNNIFHTMVGRGCTNKCSFCFNDGYNRLYNYKNVVRKRNPKNVLQELKNCKTKTIRFSDSNFLNDKAWLKIFLKQYKTYISKPFSCLIWPSDMYEKDVKLLKDAGCFMIGWGVESGNETIRKKILHRNISNHKITSLSRILHRQGLKFTVNNMCGIPTETEEDFIKTLKLNRKLNPYLTNTSLTVAYPGTNISKVNNSKIDTKKAKNFFKLFHLFVVLPIPVFLVKQIIKMPKNLLFMLIRKVYVLIMFKRTYKLSSYFCIRYVLGIFKKT